MKVACTYSITLIIDSQDTQLTPNIPNIQFESLGLDTLHIEPLQ